MTSMQIQCFLEVGRELNFTRAAQKLYLTQPWVSRSIASLEEELGTVLFVRDGSRKVALTEDGRTYLSFFLRFAAQFEDLQERVRSPKLELRFGYDSSWEIASHLPALMARCGELRPGMTLAPECWDIPSLHQGLLEDKLDAILILEDYPVWQSEIEQERITTVSRVILYAESFLGRPAEDPADFDGRDFFVMEDDRVQQLGQNIVRQCLPYHFTPRLVPVTSMDTAMARVTAGMGAVLVDEWSQRPGLLKMKLDAVHYVSLLWKAGRDAASIGALRQALKEHFQSRE